MSPRNSVGSSELVRLKFNLQCIQLSDSILRNCFWVMGVLLYVCVRLRTLPQLRLSSVASSGYLSGHSKGDTPQSPHRPAAEHLSRTCTNDQWVALHWSPPANVYSPGHRGALSVSNVPGPPRKHCHVVSTEGGATNTLRSDAISLAPGPHRSCVSVRHRLGVWQSEFLEARN